MMIFVNRSWLVYIVILFSVFGCHNESNKNKENDQIQNNSFGHGCLFEIYLNHWTIPIEGCNFARFHFKIVYKNNSENHKKIRYSNLDLCELVDTNTNFRLLSNNKAYPIYVYNDSIPPNKINFFEIKSGDSLIIDLILMNPVFYGSHSLREIMNESKHLFEKDMKVLVNNGNKTDTLVAKMDLKINYYLNEKQININDSVKLNEKILLSGE